MMKKFMATLMALIMILSLATTAFAAEGTGSISISNAAMGETYKIYKLFDATVTGTDGGSIAYTGEIPTELAEYFVKDAAGNITATEAAGTTENMSDGLKTALTAWAATATATAEKEGNGSTLVFDGLAYGYYVVTTSQGKATISVTSTNPDATIIDKNSTPPVNNQKKEANGEEYFIGETITYTISFETANYDGTEQIVSYTIKDTLPEFLSNVVVTKITVDGTEIDVQQFDENGEITIPWVNSEGVNLYKNGAKLEITYTAVLDYGAAIDGAGNKNEVTITYTTTEGPGGSEYETSETVFTYAVALKKVDQNGQPLADATFQLPFYVKAEAADDGAYIYAGTEPGVGLVNELTTPENGLIIIKGVEQGEYSFTETEAPDGYNKLTAPVTVTATKTGKTTTSVTTYLDANGNVVDTKTEGGSEVIVAIEDLAATAVVVVNKTGTELPETGGMGTTLFYVFGGILMMGAVVLLVTKKRMAAE